MYVFTDFGEGTLTSSGYPNIVKEWKRGTPMSAAKTVYEGKPGDMYIAASRDVTRSRARSSATSSAARWRSGTTSCTCATRTAAWPRSTRRTAQKGVHKDWLLLELRDPYEAGGKTYAPGSLIATNFNDFMAGKRDFRRAVRATTKSALAGYAWTKDHLVLNVMEDVKNRLSVLTPARTAGPGPRSSARRRSAPSASVRWMPTTATRCVADRHRFHPDHAVDRRDRARAGGAEVQPRRSSTAASTSWEQHFATSRTAPRVPYFLVRPKDLKFDGKAPTLLYGYGGFTVSMTPTYSGGIGKGWLEKGGVYALANIRGGGEYGPRWHQAALKANRHKAYEDFAAIADDLVARKVTSPRHLGTMAAAMAAC